METIDIVENLQARINKIKDYIRLIDSCSILERCNTICYFPDTFLTIGTANKQPVVVAKDFPSQFEPEAADFICENVANGRGEYPEKISVKDYYNKYLAFLQTQLEALKLIL